PTTSVTFTGTTGAANDSNVGNNVTTVTATVIDAVDDSVGQPGGTTGATFDLSANDQFPTGSSFTILGGTCANASVSSAGVATYDVPNTGSCTVNYRVCAPGASGSPPEPCDEATLTVTASPADMSAVFGPTMPTVVSPGQVFTGLTLTCTNAASAAASATGAICVPTVSAGTVSNVVCAPGTPTNVLPGNSITCTFDYTAPGVAGGADEPTTSVTFTGTTGAANDSNVGNNVTTVTATVIDAVDDSVGQPGGTTGATFDLSANDQFPTGSSFTILGGTCANASVSSAGVATYDVPNTGSCTVNYRVCAPGASGSPPEPCDEATLTVTASPADMSAVFGPTMPTVVSPGQVFTGLTLTCTNAASAAASATGAICVPTVSAGTVSNVVCAPGTPTNVLPGNSITCTFDYTAPGVAGGADEPTTSVTFTGTTGATNDAIAANNVTTTTARVIDAVDDTATVPSNTGGVVNILTNDQLGATTNPPVGAGGLSSVTIVAGPNTTLPGATLNASNQIVVAPGTPAGTYTVEYRICANPCDTAIARITVTETSADVVVQKIGPPSVPAGGTIVYTIVVRNAGPAAANGAQVDDVLPAGITAASWTCTASGGALCSPASGSGGTVAVTLNPFPAGAIATITVTATAQGTGPLVNTARVTPPSGVSDPNPGNNTSTVTTALLLPDLVTSVTLNPTSATPGVPVTATVTLSNQGPAPASNAVVTLQLPPGAVVQSISGGGSFNPATNTVTWPAIATVPASTTNVATYTVIFTTPLTTAPVISNVTTPTTEAMTTNNPSQVTLVVLAQAREIPTAPWWAIALLLGFLGAWRASRRR
ncbi:MAG: hypothetical protein RMK02_07370, partial [Burkholderiales bacterium]|nr:hypothetical protein [Burkholderiales bacterium]